MEMGLYFSSHHAAIPAKPALKKHKVIENAAIGMGLYSYGRSPVMIGFVPASVPLIVAGGLITGIWFLEKTPVDKWALAPIVGSFGMLQDFSLDPLAIRQVHTIGEVTSARWNWLIDPLTNTNILNIPVFNFPGMMLIMFYETLCLLVGRWGYAKSGYNALVGAIYPFLSMFAAWLLMISPISQLLLWLGPVFQKGQPVEWFYRNTLDRAAGQRGADWAAFLCLVEQPPACTIAAARAGSYSCPARARIST